MMGTVISSNKEDILNLDVTAISHAIKERQFSVLEIVSVYIEKQKQINPIINAVVENRYVEALQQAKELDMFLKNNEPLSPLFGVPISVKESIHVKGMKTTGGLEHRKDLISRKDAVVISKLQEAGMIILSKTNTPALCFCQETDNRLYGRTNNPWDINRTCGGSSGGEGALLAAGGALAGIGSDIGGSIRFPSHFNGVIGFKPGFKQVSAHGHFPAVTNDIQNRMLSIGPMGKSVRDMELIYSSISENEIDDCSLKNFKIEILPSNMEQPLNEVTKRLLDDIEKVLTRSFSTFRRIPPMYHNCATLWQEMLSSNGSELIEKAAFNNDRSFLLKSFLKEKLTQRSKIHPYLSKAIFGAKLFKPSISRIREMEETILQGDKILGAYLQNRLLIFPIYHTGALKHGKVYRQIFSIRRTFLTYMPYVAYANVWGLPALTVPVGNDENNMPIAVQIISKSGNEDAIFRLGKMLEKKYRGYKRCEL
ncbi:amidase family protein [Virgibacillus sp. M23]|uniref:amidase n=1 Tax=Virgibacillus sp. M23 TaxID=3079030 RepID=UPI002A91A679|nr:amidase family protein [Virgibacillus sp. M23]MDY7043317.1 amidase family protein [Virgibacillus sp. M23]